jgi:hypothetical protein
LLRMRNCGYYLSVDCDQQDQLAHVLYTMTVFRNHCLSHGNHLVVNNVQQIVEEDVELIRIQ